MKTELDMALAASLLRNDLHLEFRFAPLLFVPDNAEIPPSITYGFGYSPGQIGVFYAEQDWLFTETPTVKIEQQEIKEIGKILTLLQSSKPSPYYHAAQRFHDLKSLPRQSEFADLAVFGIIESLITHNPEKYDPTESLTRQVSSKMCLLSRRFERGLDYAAFFKGANDKLKLWKALYAYRSKIAHGDPADFKHNDLRLLESKKTASAFLREATKLLIIQAFIEPDLISDLKDC
jgi:hypothetical protein